MELEGKISKDGRFWLVEVPSLDVMTQGKTRKDALMMIKDAILELIQSYFPETLLDDFELIVNDYKNDVFGVTTNNNKILLSLSLIRQRSKSGSTIRDASKRLGSDSPNAYAVYEKGKTNISLDKYEKLLQAANPHQHSLLRLVQELR
ncbi:MAG TPA: type II toxin-antitoxin system HicB family antitoxin [Chlamydiales bacterium]|nr:type II toxin-antitoxin system HicB family antitoxin [Chlamydiales bacterium]